MADWNSPTRDDRFIHRRVTWVGKMETEEYGNIKRGGTHDLAAQTDYKASASLSYTGGSKPSTLDLFRTYYEFTDAWGDSETRAISTCLVKNAKESNRALWDNGEYLGIEKSGDITLSSVLKVLADKSYGQPFTVVAGTNPIEKAIELVESVGLTVYAPDIPSYTLSSDHTFEWDASYLKIVNWLMAAANFQSAYPDAYGNVVMSQYVEPTKRPVSFVFKNDDNSIMLPELIDENDWQDTKNVVRLYYANENESMYAYARNLSGSKASLDSSGGREQTYTESISELPGETAEDRLESLKAMARRKLIDNSADIEYVRFSHLYVPLNPNDAAEVMYPDRSWFGTVHSMTIHEEPFGETDMELRSFVSHSLNIDVGGEILWQT